MVTMVVKIGGVGDWKLTFLASIVSFNPEAKSGVLFSGIW